MATSVILALLTAGELAGLAAMLRYVHRRHSN
jgi:hypothetical protein